MIEQNHLDLLQEQIDAIEDLNTSLDSLQLRQWREETLMVLDMIISEESKYYTNFENISFKSGIISMRDPRKNKMRNEEAMKSGLKKAKASLNAILFGLKKGLL